LETRSKNDFKRLISTFPRLSTFGRFGLREEICFQKRKLDLHYPVSELLDNFTPEQLNYWLSFFSVESRSTG